MLATLQINDVCFLPVFNHNVNPSFLYFIAQLSHLLLAITTTTTATTNEKSSQTFKFFLCKTMWFF